MRTKILILICLAFAVTVNAAQLKVLMPVISVGGGGAPPSACTNTSIVFWWRAEAYDFSSTNGTLDYSAGDDTGTNVGTTLHADYGKIGKGIDHPAGWDRVDFGVITTTLDDEGRAGAWIYFNTFQTNSCTTGNCDTLWGMSYTIENTIKLYQYGTDELRFWWKDNYVERTNLITTDANISTGTWYFIEWAWKTSTNYREIWVNGVSKASTTSETINSFGGDVATMTTGEIFSNGSDYYSDQWIISSDSTKDLYSSCKDETEYP